MYDWKSCCRGGMHPQIGLLLLRIGVGVIFIAHGWMKLQNLAATNAFMVSLGLPNGWGTFMGLLELFGGIAILLGTYVGIAGLLLAADMLGAILLVKGSKGLIGGYELELLLLLASLAIAKLGPGMYSYDGKRGMGGIVAGCCGGACGEGCGDGACGPMEGGCCDSGMCEMPSEDEHMVLVEDGEVVAVVEEPKA